MECPVCDGECLNWFYTFEKYGNKYKLCKTCDPGIGNELVQEFDYTEREAGLELLATLRKIKKAEFT